jgi:broad specificity phosphatase PhoE
MVRRFGCVRVLAPVLATVAGSAPALAQQAVILVRHAEQALVGGMMDGDPPLTEEGSRRAKILAGALKDTGVKAIFVSQYVRARETAAPLAAALGSPVQVVAKDDLTGLSEQLRQHHANDTVLVVGHSDTIPALLKSWGHPAPVEIGRREFDSVWVVVPRSGQAPVVSRLRLP